MVIIREIHAAYAHGSAGALLAPSAGRASVLPIALALPLDAPFEEV
jgi:hypothetical protein